MTDKIEIKEYQYVEDPIIITKVAVQVIQLILNQGCKLNYQLFDNTGKLVKNGIMDMYNEDYTAWGNSDDYVIDFVLGKLGLARAVV